MKVLFVGNSHTYFNDMPRLFCDLVGITTGTPAEAVMLAYPGRELAWHLDEYFSLRYNLMYGGYDYCVIQQAAHPYPPVEDTLAGYAAICRLCKKYGVKPVVFMTWAQREHPENQQIMIDTCRRVARENDAILAPVGAAWQTINRTRPDVDLYHVDGAHAGPYGDFLIAAALCRATAGRVSPEVCGVGRSFLSDPRNEVVIEEADAVPCALDKEKCAAILAAVEAEF